MMIKMEYERDEVVRNENFHNNKYLIHKYVLNQSKTKE